MSAPRHPQRVGFSLRAWALSGLIAAIAIAMVVSVVVSVLSQPQRGPHVVQLADQADPELVGRGRQIYATLCATCHGANLEGAPNWRVPLPDGSMPAPPHDATGTTWRSSDQELFAIVKYGGATSRKSGMPAFGGLLKDREIWDVLAYIKSTWPQELIDRQGSGQP